MLTEMKYFSPLVERKDNWAVKAESLKRKQGHIIVSSIEHHAVTESALWLKNYGIDVTFAPVDEQGIVKLEQLEK